MTMLFAVKYPLMVAKLIIVDIAPRYYQPHHSDILTALNSVDFKIQNTRKLVDQKISELIFDPVTRAFLLKNVYWKEKGVLAFRFNLQSLTKNNDEVGKALPSFKFFDKKTLFLAGGKSEYITNREIPLIIKHNFYKIFNLIIIFYFIISFIKKYLQYVRLLNT